MKRFALFVAILCACACGAIISPHRSVTGAATAVRSLAIPIPLSLPAAPITNTVPTASVTLAWDPSPSPEATGYNVYYGDQSRAYTNHVDAGNATTVTITNLSFGSTYYFAATAYDVSSGESDYSNEVAYTPLKPWSVLKITPQSSTSTLGPWTGNTNWPAWYATNNGANLFFRLSITNGSP